MGRLTDLRNELMHDPEFRAGYEEQGQLVRFGRMMREARESRRLTQSQLAARLGINQSEISRLEKGEGVNGPTFERIVAVAHALDLKLVVGFAGEAWTAPAPGGMQRERVRLPGRDFADQQRGRAPLEPTAANAADALWGTF